MCRMIFISSLRAVLNDFYSKLLENGGGGHDVGTDGI